MSSGRMTCVLVGGVVSLLRLPGRGWYTPPDGIDMENNGAQPDVKVPVTPADETAGRDPQLDAATQVTLAQIDGGIAQP